MKFDPLKDVFFATFLSSSDMERLSVSLKGILISADHNKKEIFRITLDGTQFDRRLPSETLSLTQALTVGAELVEGIFSRLE